jgi:eukaryotic-like serine/threonine-protein kinase
MDHIEPRVVGGHYLLGEAIGRGGMAAVYLATDKRSGQPVAVKILHSHLAEDAHARQRFATEVRAARRIDHPNVVRALDDGVDDDRPFLVMELVRGESLADYLEREGKMATDLALDLMRQAGRGLAAMHASGVVHRDVKPGNLLLVREGGDQPWAVKVADFGLARIGGRTITAHGLPMGTTKYMAPEQVMGDEPDPRSDLYGLGMVMFFALTGELPFTGKTAAQIIAHQVLSPAPPPSWLVEELDPGVDLIVVTALRKDPESRYPTMHAMVHDIERALGMRGGPVRGVELAGEDAYRATTPDSQEILEGLRKALC